MNLAQLAGNTRPLILRPIREREGAIIEYRIILTAVIRAIQAETRASVMPRYRTHRQRATDGLVLDDETAETWFVGLGAAAAIAASEAIAKMRLLFERERQAFTRRFIKTVKAGTKVALSPAVVPTDDLDAALRLAVQENAALIRSLSQDAVTRVERAVIDARRNRASVKKLRLILQREFGTGRSRAELIATDQIASMHADHTRIHAEAVGIGAYAWNTQNDGRVRPLHAPLQGHVYRFGQPTGAEGGQMPGKPIRCRCIAQLRVDPA